jgi:acetyl esterase
MLDPVIDKMLKALAALGLPDYETLTPPEARAQMEALIRARAQAPVPVGRTEDRQIPGPAGRIPVRIYWPEGAPVGIVVFYHGGGWVIGSLYSHDNQARAICAGSGAVVIAVDYRLAPEHKFPAAVEDAYAALEWADANARALGCPEGRLAVAGDSAGGNLATVAALTARDRKGPRLRLQVLIYPTTDLSFAGDIFKTYPGGYGALTPALMHWFRGHYLRSAADIDDWRASPAKAPSLARLPPALIITAEYDVLRPEGIAYAHALRAAGVDADLNDFPGMIHMFFGMAPSVQAASEAQAYVGQAIRAALAR